MSRLDCLNLSGAGLAAEEAPGLAEQLREFPFLKRVDVSGNPGLDRASLSLITASFSIFSAELKLGWREFDVDCEEIDAIGCDVSAADCAALAARMRTGEINKLKTLFLVRSSFPFCFVL